jgi:hypothetical protein
MNAKAIAVVVALLVVVNAIGFLIGSNSVTCPDTACPSEELWIGTSYGLMHFEVGELDDKDLPYIIDRKEYDELINEIETEMLKQQGSSL